MHYMLDLLAVRKGRKVPFYSRERQNDSEKVIEVEYSWNFTFSQAEAGKLRDYAD